MKKSITYLLVLALILSFSACSKKPLSGEEVYNLIAPSTVEVTAKGRGFESTGTGFFIDTAGTLITNYHVIEDCTEAHITISDGGTYDVLKVVGYSVELDLALLSTSHQNSKAVSFRNSEVHTGETVYALGSSLGLTGTFSEGVISTAERELDGVKYIQTTAPISSGNSGGPLVDGEGKVVGITSAGFTDGQNLNLAIPVSTIESINGGTPMTLSEVRKAESKGVLVVAVEPSFYPYSEEKNGQYFGLHVDIAEELAARNGYVAEFVSASWEDLFTGIENGSYNLVFGVEPTPERQEIYANTPVGFTDIYYDGMSAMYNVKNLELSFGEWSQFTHTIEDMIEDGTIDAMLKYYNLT